MGVYEKFVKIYAFSAIVHYGRANIMFAGSQKNNEGRNRVAFGAPLPHNQDMWIIALQRELILL